MYIIIISDNTKKNSRSPQVQQQSPRSPQAQNQGYPSNSFPVHIEIRTVPYNPDSEPAERSPNAVYVTQPIVMQHPGPGIEPPYQGVFHYFIILGFCFELKMF